MSVDWVRKLFESSGPSAHLGLGDAPNRGRIWVSAAHLLTSHDAVRQALLDFGGVGWLTYTDQVDEIDGSTWKPREMPILSAESCKGSTSLHLRQSPDGWLCTTIEESSEGDEYIFGHEFARMPTGRVCYQVAWRATGAELGGVYRAHIARFSGYADEE